jgi:hypothetical protein
VRALPLLSILLFGSQAFSDQKLEETLLVVSAASDILSTELGLRLGASEANPLGKEAWQRIAIKAGATAGILAIGRYLDREGCPGKARFLRLSAVSLWFSATGFNVAVTLRMP